MRLNSVIIWSCSTAITNFLKIYLISIFWAIQHVIVHEICSESMTRLFLSMVSKTESKPLLCQQYAKPKDHLSTSHHGIVTRYNLLKNWHNTNNFFGTSSYNFFFLDNEISKFVVMTNFVIDDVNKECICHFGNILY